MLSSSCPLSGSSSSSSQRWRRGFSVRLSLLPPHQEPAAGIQLSLLHNHQSAQREAPLPGALSRWSAGLPMEEGRHRHQHLVFTSTSQGSPNSVCRAHHENVIIRQKQKNKQKNIFWNTVLQLASRCCCSYSDWSLVRPRLPIRFQPTWSDNMSLTDFIWIGCVGAGKRTQQTYINAFYWFDWWIWMQFVNLFIFLCLLFCTV